MCRVDDVGARHESAQRAGAGGPHRKGCARRLIGEVGRRRPLQVVVELHRGADEGMQHEAGGVHEIRARTPSRPRPRAPCRSVR